MNQRDEFFGGAAPFQGDLTFRLRSIPANVRIIKATATVTPLRDAFAQNISFTNNIGPFGTMKNETSGWVEVEFHTRRTLVSVAGTYLTNTTLQGDFGGGVYVDISQTGAVKGPDDNRFQLSAGEGGPLPGLTVTKFKLTRASLSDKPPQVSSVIIRAVPSNVSLRTGDLGPFWTHLGDMIQEETTPDFGSVLQGFLAKAAIENGFYVVPLILHSDSLGKLKITVDTEFVIQQTAIPDGLKNVVLPYDLSGVAQHQADVLKINVPRNVRVVPEQTSARIKGAFDETRVAHGPIGAVESKTEVAIPAGTAQAQPILLDSPAAVTAVDLLLKAVGGSARLRLDVRGDLAGKPDDPSLLPQPAELVLDPKSDGTAAWVSIPLSAEFRFQPNTHYWLVLQTLQGTMSWSADPATPPNSGMQRTQDGGLSWRIATPVAKNGGSAAGAAAGPLAGYLRLRAHPANFQVPIEIQTGTGKTATRIKLDRFAPLGRVDFSPGSELAQALNASLKKVAQDLPPPCPQGEHVVNGDFKQQIVLSKEESVPADWTLTSGSLGPGQDRGTSIVGFRSDGTPVAAALSQVVPVAASCLYEFSFFASFTQSDPDAVAEVFWLNQQSGLQRTDSILFQTTEVVVRHRARFTAPAGVSQAEIRFRVPEGSQAYINNVSLQVAANTLVNADLQVLESDQPSDWTSTPPPPNNLRVGHENDGSLLKNHGTTTIDLSQSIAVKTGQSFIFDFEKGSETDADFSAIPQLELRWLAADKTIASPSVILQILPESSSHTCAQGMVPEQVAIAEVHLILPAKSVVVVRKISLQFSETQAVPLTFIAQAPGQLTVSDLRVGFEPIPVPPPPVPSAGLSSPTPLGRVPGEEPCGGSYCSCCGEKNSMTEAATSVTPANRPAMIGKCAACGSTLIQHGGQLPGPGETRTPFPATFIVEPKLAAKPALPPLTAIAGIGKAREEQLVRAGIDSLEKLAATTPAEVANAMAGVSIKHAPHFINAARELLEAARSHGRQTFGVAAVLPDAETQAPPSQFDRDAGPAGT